MPMCYSDNAVSGDTVNLCVASQLVLNCKVLGIGVNM